MTVSRAWTLHCAQLAGATPVFLDQMENQDYDAGIDQMLIQANGSIYPQFAAVGLAQPKISFATSNLVAALSQGMLGYAIGPALPYTSGEFYWRQYASQGGFKPGNVNQSMAMALGAIFPRRLSARTGERATLDMDVIPIYNGTNSPFVITSNVALPIGVPAINHVHTAGPCTLNGVAFSGVQSLEVDFGIREMLLHSDGEAYNTFIATPSVMPSITLETYDLEAVNTFDTAAAITTATKFYLRGIQPSGFRIPDGTAEHISLTVTAGMIYVETASAKPGDAGLARVRINLTWDGTNSPIQFNTATAIT